MRSPLNLATRPAGNERLPTLLFTIGAAGLLTLTLWHGLAIGRLASAAATTLEQEVARLEEELRELRGRESSLRAVKTDPAVLARWRLLQGLVDQRTFSWTGLLASLESTLPGDVRLLAISPSVKAGSVRLALEVAAREAEDAVALVQTLEDRAEFDEVFLLRLDGDREGMRSSYEMTYRPEAAAPAAPTAVVRAAGEEPGP